VVSAAGGPPLVFKRILAATDGTEASLRGVEVAVNMVVACRCEFVLLTVITVPQHIVLTANMDQRAVERYVEQMAQSTLKSALELLHLRGVGAEVKAVVGPAAETILSEIESSGADLVVMGRRGRQEPKDLILGSVSYRVSRHVRVPILLVP